MTQHTTIQKIRSRLDKYTAWEHIRGAWLARKFTRHGITVVSDGSPMPRVINRGGEIHTENCQFYAGVRLEVGPGARLDIGNGTYLNRNTLVVAHKQVKIGRDCRISWDVIIMDTDQHAIEGHEQEDRPVLIGDHVWIGCRSIILKGVRIGDHAVIAAGAVVTNNVEPYAVVAGVPACVIRTGDSVYESDSQLHPTSSV